MLLISPQLLTWGRMAIMGWSLVSPFLQVSEVQIKPQQVRLWLNSFSEVMPYQEHSALSNFKMVPTPARSLRESFSDMPWGRGADQPCKGKIHKSMGVPVTGSPWSFHLSDSSTPNLPWFVNHSLVFPPGVLACQRSVSAPVSCDALFFPAGLFELPCAQ